MMYEWIDKNTEIIVEVERTMKEYEVPPDKPEALKAGMEVEDYVVADWQKVITGGMGHVGFGLKGYWMLLLGVGQWLYKFPNILL